MGINNKTKINQNPTSTTNVCEVRQREGEGREGKMWEQIHETPGKMVGGKVTNVCGRRWECLPAHSPNRRGVGRMVGWENAHVPEMGAGKGVSIFPDLTPNHQMQPARQAGQPTPPAQRIPIHNKTKVHIYKSI